jgi:cytochrome bd-type quinol oxidase subunit 1
MCFNRVRSKDHTASAPNVRKALACFGVGAFCGAVVFVCAYLTQLQYGNKNWMRAKYFHFASYAIIILSAVAFLAGLVFASFGVPM